MTTQQEQLLLKDICGRAIHGVRIKHEVYGTILECRKYADFEIPNNQFGISWAWRNIGSYKPILFPLSCVEKELTIKGEKIIPIIELAKISLPNDIGLEWSLPEEDPNSEGDDEPRCIAYRGDRRYIFRVYDDTGEFDLEYEDKFGYTDGLIVQPFLIYDWLNAHHFDYRGLIGQGLAIDAIEMDGGKCYE